MYIRLYNKYVSKSAVLYSVQESRKTPQQCWALVDVTSVRRHIRCGTDRSFVTSECAVSSPVSIEQPEDCCMIALGLCMLKTYR